jgi:hypothetical protein
MEYILKEYPSEGIQIFLNGKHKFHSFQEYLNFIETEIRKSCPLLKAITFSYSPETI